MTRRTCQAYELTDDTYVLNNGVIEKIVKAHTVLDRTTIINGNGDSWRISSSANISLATEAESAEYERERDRRAVADALRSLGDKILSRSLPVPVGGRGIVVSFDLADDSDLEPWSQWLSKRPQRGTSRPHIQAEAEGVEVYVHGPGTSGEFGPDLADAALTESVEHRDSVGAFPVVESLGPIAPCMAVLDLTDSISFTCRGSLGHERAHFSRDHEHEWVDREQARAEMPERDGWPVSDGHRPPVDDEAMRADRYNGEA